MEKERTGAPRDVVPVPSTSGGEIFWLHRYFTPLGKDVDFCLPLNLMENSSENKNFVFSSNVAVKKNHRWSQTPPSGLKNICPPSVNAQLLSRKQLGK